MDVNHVITSPNLVTNYFYKLTKFYNEYLNDKTESYYIHNIAPYTYPPQLFTNYFYELTKLYNECLNSARQS
jgi:hypothetical protein